MKISDLFKERKRTYSFEFFPPRDEISAVDFGINVGILSKLSPSFVTVTYGAGGSNQERTFDLVNYLQNKMGLLTMAHYTCVNASRSKILDDLSWLKDHQIENLMVLRGDPPKGETTFVAHPDGFAHASDLAAFAAANFDFCMGGAAYPEKHPEAGSYDEDVLNLKKKVDAGCRFLMTQLFFDNEYYFDLVKRARTAGIECPIIPGIIPLTAYSQIERFTRMSQTHIPDIVLEKMEEYRDNPKKIYQLGMDFAIRQCRDLLMMGAPGLHFYTLNKSRATVEIFETLQR